MLHRFRIPDPQGIYDSVSVAHNRQVKRNGSDGTVICLFKYLSAFCIPFYLNISAKFNLAGILFSPHVKRISVFQPVIRYFYLIAVFYLLFEHTVSVTDAASVRRISQCSQGIQKTGGQPSQTSVAQRGIRFLILNGV